MQFKTYTIGVPHLLLSLAHEDHHLLDNHIFVFDHPENRYIISGSKKNVSNLPDVVPFEET